MPLDFNTASAMLENIRFRRPNGSTIALPGGRLRLVLAAALHSETLETLLVVRDPATGRLSAIAPGAARDADEDLDRGDLLDGVPLSTWRHRKGGTYTSLGAVKGLEGDMILYAAHADGLFWLRPRAMFEDGRFEASSEAPLSAAEMDLA